jgi:hypothetical protein
MGKKHEQLAGMQRASVMTGKDFIVFCSGTLSLLAQPV